tara:strand:- start:158 stop:958 length:801 start_codon:yes stop_codon:yes gene_type:complete
MPKKPEHSGNDAVGAPEFSFITPTEMVTLPSLGRFYPTGHHLCDVEQIEIKFMTAKEEDILTSENYIKNGLVIDKLLRSIIVDKRINPDELLVADRNALIIAARISAYGNDYHTGVKCPSCGKSCKYTFDLYEQDVYHGDEELEISEQSTYTVTCPLSKYEVELRILNGSDEKHFAKLLKKSAKESSKFVTQQLQRVIASVADESSPEYIKAFSQHLPAKDSIYIRTTINEISPSINISQEFSCDNCSHSEIMEVPFNTEFFWPDR